MHSRTSAIRWLLLSLAPLVCPSVTRADSPQNTLDVLGNDVTIYATAGRSADSNLYRLPANPTAYGIDLPAGRSRTDQLTEAGAGIDAMFEPFNQPISLQATVEDVRYEDNSYLNHLAGAGLLTWDWMSGNEVTGEVTASYSRALSGFVNNRVFQRDLIGQNLETAFVRWALTADFSIKLAGDTGTTTHDDDIEKYQDNRKESGTVSLEYSRTGTDIIRLNFREARARFDDSILSYLDKSAFGSVTYLPSDATTIDVDAGWYERSYTHTTTADFSGGTGHASINWQATPLTAFKLKISRELSAYLNNESDYYVTEGGSGTVTWNPTYNITASLSGTREKQDYKGSGIGVLSTVRTDHVSSGKLALTWAPRQWLEFTIADALERRTSTNGYFTYDDNIASGSFRLIW